MLYSQVWLQRQLSYVYISKEIAYDNFTLAEFASFLCGPECQLMRYMYWSLCNTYIWQHKFLGWQSAVFMQQCCSKLSAVDYVGVILLRISKIVCYTDTNQPQLTNAPVLRQTAAVQFCKAFQSRKCSFNKDHYGQSRNGCNTWEPSGLRNGKFGHLKWPNFDPYPL